MLFRLIAIYTVFSSNFEAVRIVEKFIEGPRKFSDPMAINTQFAVALNVSPENVPIFDHFLFRARARRCSVPSVDGDRKAFC